MKKSKTKITNVSSNEDDAVIEILQFTGFPKNGRTSWDKQAVYLNKQMVEKLIKLYNK